jgi:maltooligosyltrehalose trehalohydrolase
MDGVFKGHSLSELIFYELHVGTFSPQSSFDGILSCLDHLLDLGITAIELMPIAQFPGDRNWGYDGVYPFAVHRSYGGPEGLLKLVGGCHDRGLSVFLDVVYNHLGPEGNYLSTFGPYFSHTTKTPWGEALNFDEPGSDHVRHFFLENLRYFANVFDIDGFRFDAVHAIRDQSAHPFLADVSFVASRIASRRGRPLHLVAESNLNDRRMVLPRTREGLGFDAQWNDDFHHAMHVTFTGEKTGYYADFDGREDLFRALEEGFVYQGQFAPSFNHRRGSSSSDLPASSFVFFAQNHDQIGNRMNGERLSSLQPPDALRVIASLVILSPGLPLLFMGEEYGETRPFLYFTSHGDPDLIQAVREGRAREFASFSWKGPEIPDPQDPTTFERSRLLLTAGREITGNQRVLLSFTRHLIGLRKSHPCFYPPPRIKSAPPRILEPVEGVIANLRGEDIAPRAMILWNLSPFSRTVPGDIFPRDRFGWKGGARKVLDSQDPVWNGQGSQVPVLLPDRLPLEEIHLEAFHTVVFLEDLS